MLPATAGMYSRVRRCPDFTLFRTMPTSKTAYSEVPDAIADIIESDEGTPMIVELENSYSEYIAMIPEAMRPSIRHYWVKKVA